MSPDELILEALNTHLYEFATDKGVNVAWTGVEFEPGTAEYLKPSLLPARTVQAANGEDADNRHTGIYQIAVFYPENLGETLAVRRAGELALHFKRGTLITYNGRHVRINEPPWPSPSLITETDLQVPLNVPYWADLPNGDIP